MILLLNDINVFILNLIKKLYEFVKLISFTSETI